MIFFYKIFFLTITVSVNLYCVAGNTNWSINILSPGIFGFDFAGTLNLSGPGIDSGIALLKKTYPEYKWTSIYLPANGQITGSFSCAALIDNIQLVLARWFYAQSDNGKNIYVIVTPGCGEGEYLNQLAAAWDILLITSSEGAQRIPDKHPSWITTTPFPPPGESYCTLMKRLGWRKVYVVLESRFLADPNIPYYNYAANMIMPLLTKCKVVFTQNVCSMTDGSCAPSVILQDFNKRGRVMLYFGRPLGLRKILHQAFLLGMTLGEHVYLTLTPWNAKMFGNNFHWQNFDEDDEIVREAYKSVIWLKLMDESSYSTPIMESTIAQWKNLSQTVYKNVNLRIELPFPLLIATHAAVELAGKFINESLFGNDHMLPSGRVMANTFFNRTYNLQLGQLNITAMGNFSFRMRVSYFDEESKEFKAFLQSSFDQDDVIWNNIAEGRWFGRSEFPPDEPRCGLDGNRDICVDSSNRIQWAVGFTIIGIVLVLVIVQLIRYLQYERNKLWIDWWKLSTELLILPNAKPFRASFRASLANFISRLAMNE